jgi:nondiscriminating aspartyl-tRNA synthetase
MKVVSEIVGEKCEFEDPAVIKERYGLTIGGIPPFGKLLGMDTYFDEKIESMQEVGFNCGLLTESIVMKGKDLFKVADPTRSF